MVAKSVISSQAGQSAVNRIGKAGAGGRESRAASPGAAIGHPRPQDAAAAIRFGKSPRRIRSAPFGGAPLGRRADSPNCRFGVPRAPAALSGSGHRLGCDLAQSAPAMRAGTWAGWGVAALAGGAGAALRSSGPFQPLHGRMHVEAAESPLADPPGGVIAPQGRRAR